MATTFPFASVERRELAPVFESLRFVPESNVRVPEVKLSEVSERRNERESMPSNVVASPPEDDRQLPFGIWKHPAVSLIPLANEEVPLEVERIAPEEMVRPAEVERPAVVIPPKKVEVAVLVISRLPEDLREPPVMVSPALEARPPPEIPPMNVEVAVEVALMLAT